MPDEAAEIIKSLTEPERFWNLHLGGKARKVLLMRRLRDVAEFDHLHAIAPFVLSRYTPLAHEAATTIRMLLAKATPQQLLSIASDRYWMPHEWYTLSINDVLQLKFPVADSCAVWSLLSTHHNGYVRELAVRSLITMKSAEGYELPFLLYRLNDWVFSVYSAASDAIQARLTEADMPHFIRFASLLRRLNQELHRASNTTLIQTVIVMMKDVRWQEHLLKAMEVSDTKTQRFIASILLSMDTDLETLAERLMRSPDPQIRLQSAEALCKKLEDAPLLRWLPRFHRDPVLRKVMLDTYVERFPALAVPKIEEGLLSHSIIIRRHARYLMSRYEQMDYRAFYTSAIQDRPDKRAAAIAGLGETGDREDVTIVEPYCRAPAVPVRKAALHAMSRLNGSAFVEFFLQSLSDAQPGISRIARDALIKNIHLVSARRLWDIYNQHEFRHVRRNALFIIMRCSKWEAIPLLLHACVDTDSELAIIARNGVCRWCRRYNRNLIQPTQEQMDRFREAFARAETMSESNNFLDQLRSLIQD